MYKLHLIETSFIGFARRQDNKLFQEHAWNNCWKDLFAICVFEIYLIEVACSSVSTGKNNVFLVPAYVNLQECSVSSRTPWQFLAAILHRGTPAENSCYC